MTGAFLSGRGRAALDRHQRQVTLGIRDLQAADRVVTGALLACDASGQRESVATYLEAVQALRVAVERLEGFLRQRLAGPDAEGAAAGGAADCVPRPAPAAPLRALGRPLPPGSRPVGPQAGA